MNTNELFERYSLEPNLTLNFATLHVILEV